MIYGEVIQRWRLAKGAALRKWPRGVSKPLYTRALHLSYYAAHSLCLLAQQQQTQRFKACSQPVPE